jgi:transcriptional regulator with XRE-family HTH domain
VMTRERFLIASDDRGAQGGSPVARRGSSARDRVPADAQPGISASDAAELAPDAGWRGMLRDERLRLKLTQAEVARLVSVAPITFRSYESGARTPSRETLARALVALQVPQDRARRILASAGYAPFDRLPPAAHPQFYFTLDEARAEIERVDWPRLVANNAMEVVAMNRALQDLCRFDFEGEHLRRDRLGFHFLGLLSERWFREHVVNIDEVLAVVVSVFKGVPRAGAVLDQPSPVLRAVLERFSALYPAAVPRLLRMWDQLPAMDSKVQWTYPIVWDEPGMGRIRFRCLVSDAGEADALAFNDWFPADAASHVLLERVLQSRRHAPGGSTLDAHGPAPV